MILNVYPVSYIAAITVYRDRFIVERVRECEWQKFFGKLPRSIVIAAAGHHCVEPKSVMRGANEMFCCRLRSSVRTVWSEWRVFGEEGLFAFRQAPHYLIGGDLNETLDASRASSVKQDLCAGDVRAQELRQHEIRNLKSDFMTRRR